MAKKTEKQIKELAEKMGIPISSLKGMLNEGSLSLQKITEKEIKSGRYQTPQQAMESVEKSKQINPQSATGE